MLTPITMGPHWVNHLTGEGHDPLARPRVDLGQRPAAGHDDHCGRGTGRGYRPRHRDGEAVTGTCTAAFLCLEAMVREAEAPPRERTIEEDRMAMEDMVLQLEGPEALARYQYRWTFWGLLL